MRAVSLALCSLLSACATEAQPASSAPPEGAPAAPAEFENDPRWHPTLRKVAGAYEAWGRVDDEARWAPWLCRMPTPALARFSQSGDADTHGAKLYTLYALDPVAYGAPQSATPPDRAAFSELAQAVVKEAFVPTLAADSTDFTDARDLRPAVKDGAVYHTGPRAGLYVMAKLAKDEPGTDAGWVYGTISADLQTITAAGRLPSCIACHEQAPKDRLFGLELKEPREK